jgi:hypothetical protein
MYKRGKKKQDSKGLNPSPKTQNFARESPTFAQKRRGIGAEEDERKAPLLMTPAEKTGAGLAGSLLTLGVGFKLLPPSFPYR